MIYDSRNWYWDIGGLATEVYSSRQAQFVPMSDAIYQSWLAAGNFPTRILSEAELWDVLADQFPSGISSGNAIGQEALKTRQLDRSDRVMLQIAFNHENRIRTLESRPQVTIDQFKTAIKALL